MDGSAEISSNVIYRCFKVRVVLGFIVTPRKTSNILLGLRFGKRAKRKRDMNFGKFQNLLINHSVLVCF